ncbi:hypothetical protein [Nocardioides aquiterrae]
MTAAQYARMRAKNHPEEAKRTREPVYLPGMTAADSTAGGDPRDPRPEPRIYR